MNKYYISDRIKRFFSLNKGLAIAVCLILSLGFLTGVLCLLKTNQEIKVSLIQNFVLRNFLSKSYSIFAFVLVTFFLNAIFLFLLFLCSYLKFGKIVGILLGLYFAYIVGIDCCVIFKLNLSILGVLLGVTYLVFSICILFLLLTFFFKMNSFCHQTKVFGSCPIRGKELNIFLFFLLILSAVIIVMGIVMTIFIKIFVFY